MFLSVFTDELATDLAEALPTIRSWGLEHCDLRGRILGRAFEALSPEQLIEVRRTLDRQGMKVGCLQSSLAKVHLPDAERCRAEEAKLEGVIRAADALDCRLVRSFFYWQPPKEESGTLAVRPDMLQRVLDHFAPLAERAKEAGLLLAFENCGVKPPEVLAMLDALGVPSWGLAWDLSNGWDSEERKKDETEYIVRYARRARCVHVKARGAVLGISEELVPWDRILATCNAAGLQGPVSVETHNPDASVSNVEMSHRVVEAIRRAWPTAAPGDIYGAARSTRRRHVERSYADDPVGFVVVGLGMGHNIAKAISNTPGTRLVGVCDIDEDRARRNADEFGVPYTTDIRLWLDDDQVEVIYVLTPTGRHAEIALPALEAGKHVLTTKPMEASVEACDAMIRKAKEKGVLLGVDFGMRFSPATVALRAAIAEGRFGQLLSGELSIKILRRPEYYQSNGGWRGTKRWDGGGVGSNQAIHHIDEMVYCIGVPVKVRCDVWTQNYDIEAENLACATWLYEDGLVLTFYATTYYPVPTWYTRFELHGTEGAYSSVRGGPGKPATQWYLNDAWTDVDLEGAQSPWLNSADNLAAAIRTGAELVCSGRDGRRSRAILDTMYRSAYSAGGGWLDVEAELE